MLGLALLSLTYFINDQLVLGCIFFVFSISFKQMSLYYSPLVFSYLLGLCIFPRLNVPRFFLITGSTLFAFTLVFFPLLLSGGYPVLFQCLYRIFPFQRGLWEDKVANAWCVFNTLIKFKQKYSPSCLAKLSFAATAFSILPSCSILFLRPRKDLLPWGLLSCAFGFFLFSFQVHEKSILLPLMPATMLLVTPNRNTKAWIGWINTFATFSMWPLLKRDGLLLQYAALLLYWLWLGGFVFHPPGSLGTFETLIHMGSYTLLALIHLLEAFFSPPNRYPHLWVLLNMVLSFFCFVIFWFWSHWKLFSRAGFYLKHNPNPTPNPIHKRPSPRTGIIQKP